MIKYKEYLKGIFTKGTEARMAEAAGISRQAVNSRMKNFSKAIEDEAKRNREKLLIEKKYQYIKPNCRMEMFALFQSMVFDGFVQRDIAEATGIPKTKVNRILKDYGEGGGKYQKKYLDLALRVFRS